MKKRLQNQTKKKSHQERYGMTRSEWAKFKKENPQEAHQIRLKAISKIKYRVEKQNQ